MALCVVVTATYQALSTLRSYLSTYLCNKADLNMFQAYLWLCVMQGSLAPVEDELIRVCTMVMPRVGVPWEMILKWNEMLMDEVTDRTLLTHQPLLEPYMAGFMNTFKQSKDQFTTD